MGGDCCSPQLCSFPPMNWCDAGRGGCATVERCVCLSPCCPDLHGKPIDPLLICLIHGKNLGRKGEGKSLASTWGPDSRKASLPKHPSNPGCKGVGASVKAPLDHPTYTQVHYRNTFKQLITPKCGLRSALTPKGLKLTTLVF